MENFKTVVFESCRFEEKIVFLFETLNGIFSSKLQRLKQEYWNSKQCLYIYIFETKVNLNQTEAKDLSFPYFKGTPCIYINYKDIKIYKDI